LVRAKKKAQGLKSPDLPNVEVLTQGLKPNSLSVLYGPTKVVHNKTEFLRSLFGPGERTLKGRH